jgi:hypothetical protein
MRDNFLALPHPLFTPQVNSRDITNSVAEASLFSTAPTILGNSLGSNGMVTCRFNGDFLFNNATGDALRLKVKFGGITYIDTVSGVGAINTGRGAWWLEVRVINQGATNVQHISMLLSNVRNLATGAALGAFTMTTGVGSAQSGLGGGVLANNPAGAVDTTINQVLDVTGTWSVASVNDSFRVQNARGYLEQA